MQRTFLKILVTAQLMCLTAYGQSLGEVARENQEKKVTGDASGAQPKVFTNKDLPKDPEANQGPIEAPLRTDVVASSKADDYRSAEQRMAEQRATEQWRRQILAQESKIASLQARIDQLNASVRAVGGNVQYEGPYNRYQARQLERAAQVQLQLDEQKRKLDGMQEAARRAGMHTTVYDP
jgi:hypothetical protein